ncbi:hypothetical protein FN846DRAFT_556738 [Sphaerosporella brunnea]|uniref:Uncharacterized protein n=1 Tax=Sphaerosporella brunnea TaxID=1250544 RepID=A0A5J5ECF2_9PEZI|nr:hypothetical protein FN846DRAFT_556738 [Sphaerosporella brunnea]
MKAGSRRLGQKRVDEEKEYFFWTIVIIVHRHIIAGLVFVGFFVCFFPYYFLCLVSYTFCLLFFCLFIFFCVRAQNCVVRHEVYDTGNSCLFCRSGSGREAGFFVLFFFHFLFLLPFP